MKWACLALVAATACSKARPPRPVLPSVLPSEVSHLLVTVTPDWDATAGKMARFTRGPSGWTAAGEPIPVVVGRTGIAWGRGLHGDGAPAGRSGPVKVEGDGKAPAGIFWIRGAYGYDAAPPQGTQVPWAQLGPDWRCVDDPRDGRYNDVFDATGITQTWTSAEEMRRPDELYKYVVYVGHNDSPPRPGAGSCIFLHVWRGPESATVGCTAMEEAILAEVIRWLAPGHTAYVTLPAAEYAVLAPAWGLPEIH
jgi:zinc D-Ala-D-Ala dipeptidase